MAADETLDPYAAENLRAVAVGENLLSFDEDGAAVVGRKLPGERSNIWKGSKAIQACSDDKIRCHGARPRSGIVDYTIFEVSVSYRGKGNGEDRQYLCHTHCVNDCPHTRRIHRYRQEHAEEVGSIK
jgi:hypothetical protein